MGLYLCYFPGILWAPSLFPPLFSLCPIFFSTYICFFLPVYARAVCCVASLCLPMYERFHTPNVDSRRAAICSQDLSLSMTWYGCGSAQDLFHRSHFSEAGDIIVLLLYFFSVIDSVVRFYLSFFLLFPQCFSFVLSRLCYVFHVATSESPWGRSLEAL